MTNYAKQASNPYRWALIGAILFALVAAWFLFGRVDGETKTSPLVAVLKDGPAEADRLEGGPPALADEPKITSAREGSAAAVTEPVEVVLIDDADQLVGEWARRVVPGLPAVWLDEPRIVERVVTATHAIANGEDPLRHVKFARPETGRFVAIEEGDGRAFMTQDTPLRYRPFLDMIARLDAELVARVFMIGEPALDRAHATLGSPDSTFRSVALDALAVLIDAPRVTGPIELIPRGATWAYANPELQMLSPAERYLLRLSPPDRRRLQEKFLEIERELGEGIQD